MTTINSSLDAILTELDKAQPDTANIFKNGADKELYETYLMCAYRRANAAKYHLSKVNELLTAAAAKAAEKAHIHNLENLHPKLTITKSTISVSETRLEYAYELVAFLTAIRSALDFLATVCSLHFKNLEADSIKTFIKLSSQGKSGPLLEEITKHIDWITFIRKYRDQMIHRVIIMPKGGWFSTASNGTITTTSYPVLVPAAPPKFALDTRRARMLDEEMGLPGIMETSTTISVTNAAGKVSVLTQTVESDAAPGYVHIEEFMNANLKSFEQLFSEILARLIELKFELATLI